MVDRFSATSANFNGPALGSFVITPSNDIDLPERIRQVTVWLPGTIAYVGWDGATYATDILPPGSHPMLARRILATGTTAQNLTGWA